MTGGDSECPTCNCTATRRLIPSCGMHYGFRQPVSLCYRSHPPNPSKDRLTPSKTTMRCLFLGSRRAERTASGERVKRVDPQAPRKVQLLESRRAYGVKNKITR